MLLNDEGLAQRNHECNTEQTADQSNQRDGYHARGIDDAFLCPQEECGQGEDGTGSNGLTGRTDGLNQVVFQNGVLAQDHTDNTHRDDRRGNGSGNGHTDAQTEVCVGRTENDSQQDANQDRSHRKLGNNTFGRDIRLEIILVVWHGIFSFLKFLFILCFAVICL